MRVMQRSLGAGSVSVAAGSVADRCGAGQSCQMISRISSAARTVHPMVSM
jgi:hypothetical protein